MISDNVVRKATRLALVIALAAMGPTALAKPVVESCPLWEAYPYRAPSAIAAVLSYYQGYAQAHPECGGVSSVSCTMIYTNISQRCSVTFQNAVGYWCQEQIGTVPGVGIAVTLKDSDGSLWLSGSEPHSTWCGHNESDTEPLSKNRGPDDPCPHCNPGQPMNTNKPINTATGNKFRREVDSERAGASALEFVRYYNSQSGGDRNVVGARWTHTWQRGIRELPWGEAMLDRHDGKMLRYRGSGLGMWTGDLDAKDRLEKTAGGWKLTTSDEQVENYDSSGRLISLVDREGRATTLFYSSGVLGGADGPAYLDDPLPVPPGLLIRVEDHLGRSLRLDYLKSGFLRQVTDPTGRHTLYTVDANLDLASVTYPVEGNPAGETKTFFYNEPGRTQGVNRPHYLTGSDDGRLSLPGEAHSSFYEYDASGRAMTSGRLGNVEIERVTYDSATSSRIQDTMGTVRAVGHAFVQGVARRTHVDTPGQPRASTAYDSNGNIKSYIDAKGNLTCYAFDAARNLETRRTEGLSSSGTCTARVVTNATRTIETEWHATMRVKKRVAEPLRITTFAYHGEPGSNCAPAGASSALVCAKSLQATTDPTGDSGFAAVPDGAARIWSYAYNAQGQVTSLDGPRTDVLDTTTNAYYAAADPAGNYRAGDPASITNARGHATQFTHYDGAGRLARLVDANGLETVLAYGPRGWLRSRAVGSIATGFETTTYDHDFTGQLVKVTLPDASFIEYGYDDAHRLVSMRDGLGNRIAYTLDGAGNRTAEQAYDVGNTLARAHTREFDSLGRLYRDIGGTTPASQVTQQGYDANNNLVSTLDPLGRTTAQLYDARDHLTEVRDPFNGAASPTRYAYNGQDQLTQVTDSKGLATSYAVNGHGEMLAQSSPDTGSTGFSYDAASNLKSRLDARGVQAAYTYDELNRITLISYPDETVSYGYDTCANGIGRLCSLADRTGTTSWAYDLRGRVTSKSQTVAGLTQGVAYAWNAAGQLLRLTTPGGQVVDYTYANNWNSPASPDTTLSPHEYVRTPSG
ncbi:MAG: RHS repeat protein [Betaproteobacteria bacterium]|nr:RHS repeat protein [Betaproteobacteria bacterium]